MWGSGDYRPRNVGGVDVDLPWTLKDGEWGTDCAGAAICFAYMLVRHRLGFNRGSWATVSDDINVDSTIQDARHNRELFVLTTRPELGTLLLTPSITLASGFHQPGHVRIVVGISRVLEWDEHAPQWSLLDLAEACGPNHRAPGVILTTGAGVERHDRRWPKDEHRAVMVRVIQRA